MSCELSVESHARSSTCRGIITLRVGDRRERRGIRSGHAPVAAHVASTRSTRSRVYAADARPRVDDRPWLLANMISIARRRHPHGRPVGRARQRRRSCGVSCHPSGRRRDPRGRGHRALGELSPDHHDARDRARRAWRGVRRDRPRLAIFTRHLDLDLDGELFTRARAADVLTTEQRARRRACATPRPSPTVLRFDGDRVDVAAAVQALGERGANVVLVGGRARPSSGSCRRRRARRAVPHPVAADGRRRRGARDRHRRPPCNAARPRSACSRTTDAAAAVRADLTAELHRPHRASASVAGSAGRSMRCPGTSVAAAGRVAELRPTTSRRSTIGRRRARRWSTACRPAARRRPTGAGGGPSSSASAWPTCAGEDDDDAASDDDRGDGDQPTAAQTAATGGRPRRRPGGSAGRATRARRAGGAPDARGTGRVARTGRRRRVATEAVAGVDVGESGGGHGRILPRGCDSEAGCDPEPRARADQMLDSDRLFGEHMCDEQPFGSQVEQLFDCQAVLPTCPPHPTRPGSLARHEGAPR